MKVKKAPLRMCIVCRQMRDKRELIRVVNTDGVLNADATGKAAGRGAYVCKNRECIERALKIHAFKRALGQDHNDEFAGSLRAMCTENAHED